MKIPTVRSAATALVIALASTAASAQVAVADPWVRATVANQRVTGAFMRLTAAEPLRLVEARSPVAGSVEVHEMSMDGGVMKMRALPSLDLPAGQTVELKPSGYHLMLFDVTRTMKAGDAVPITLVVEARDGKRRNVEVQAKVRALGAHAH